MVAQGPHAHQQLCACAVGARYETPSIDFPLRRTYEGMAHCMDSGIGNITAALKVRNLARTQAYTACAWGPARGTVGVSMRLRVHDDPSHIINPMPCHLCVRVCVRARARAWVCPCACVPAFLQATGMYNRTLIVFSADNGGREDGIFGGNNYPLRGTSGLPPVLFLHPRV